MKLRLFLVLLALAAATPATAQWAAKGNDTGGIIAWSDPPPDYRDIAMRHCAGYNKVGVVTSIPRQYGDYAGFICTFAHDYDPVRDGTAFWAWLWNPGGRYSAPATTTVRISK